MKIDDSFDVLTEHGIGGILGLLANALFGTTYIVGLDGVNNYLVIGGWIDHGYKKLYVQVAYICATVGWSFTISLLIAYLINLVPGLKLRATDKAEILGMDEDQCGEFAYDYVEVRRDFLAWSHSKGETTNGEVDIPANERHGIGEYGRMLLGQDPYENGDHKHDHTGIGGDRHAATIEKKDE